MVNTGEAAMMSADIHIGRERYVTKMFPGSIGSSQTLAGNVHYRTVVLVPVTAKPRRINT